ncbi:hypothetical protein C0995_012533 [Termitomyces sp. Mi166|nr:hypothetical protein C0995_012533 [Termitomyces sp. Mi166\
MEEDKEEEEHEVTRQQHLELENYVVLTTFNNQQLVTLLPPSSEYLNKMWACHYGPKDLALELAKHVEMVQATKAFLKQQGKLLGLFVLEGFKNKRKSKTIAMDLEKTGVKHAFKSKEMIKSNSDEEDEEEMICTFKKIKHEHVEETIEKGKEKEVERTQVTVAPKVPTTAIPTSAPTASAPKIVAPDTVSMPVTARPAAKMVSVAKDPFMMS